jgi:peroxiredoxin
MKISVKAVLSGAIFLFAAATCFIHSQLLHAQGQEIVWTSQEKPIFEQIRTLRQLPDDTRARVTEDLALQIRQLPAGENKVRLVLDLANLSTEGDFGLDTLQEVTTTLAGALREHPVPREKDGPAAPYMELAELVRYEHVQASLDDPQFAAAAAKMVVDDERRQQIDFTLPDLQGKSWALRGLQGKVVLVNFWATWCPPCRKEMPDLEALYGQFKDQGLVILAISDEEESKVEPFIADKKITYPVLLDPGGKVAKRFEVEGIPKSFVYDRTGKLVAQSIDMRTRGQFLEMLSRAGLH